MIYEVINPSDAITFKAEDEKLAVATVILLGEGQYGLHREVFQSASSQNED